MGGEFMGKRLNLLGFDFGASSGRAMLGALEDGVLTLTEIHRFSNDPVLMNGRFLWDVQRFFYPWAAPAAPAVCPGSPAPSG